MAAGALDLQAQVESVLGALVKAATVELTRLFESRYGASARGVDVDVDVGRAGDRREPGTSETPGSLSPGDTKRSIGVQVDEDVCPPPELCGMCLWGFKRCDFLFTSRDRCTTAGPTGSSS